jgi:hypothetical protein
MIIGIVGHIGSGKDTVGNFITQTVGKTGRTDSFAAPLKDLCSSIFGWPRHLLEGNTMESREFRETPDIFWTRKTGIDNFTPRLALQLVGTDVLRDHFHNDIWINSLEYRLRKISDSDTVVVTDARFTNELDIIKHLCGTIIWVQRGELPAWYETAVEANGGNVVSKRIMTTRYRDVHQSEWNWAGYSVDHIIRNTGTLEDLKIKTSQILFQIQKRRKQA